MGKKIVTIFCTIFLGVAILFVSFIRSAEVNYAFGETANISRVLAEEVSGEAEIDYTLAYPGKVLPDSILWYPKVLRDRVWFLLTFDPGKKARLALLFADKRLLSSKALFENKKPELGVGVLTKAEKYLEQASAIEALNRQKGMDTASFLTTLVSASLKHRQVTDELLLIAPEQAKPDIIKLQDLPKGVYRNSRDALNQKGLPVPKSPFVGE